ncbi:MAG: cytochrome c oxidase subunit II transmembrane domain-containing protein, partial [Burkholderiaceae bacterium]
MKTSMLNRIAVAALGSASGLSSAQETAASYTPSSRFNLQTPVTDIARQVYNLHDMMLIICTLIFVSVFGVMFYSIWKHRKSRGAVAANFHENTTVEIVWTVIPFIIIIIMALPATRTVVAMKDTTNSDLTIKATGYQWKWG